MINQINPEDIIGKKFHMLTVLDYDGKRAGKHFYKCACDCGVTKIVARSNIGAVKSCGCLRKITNINDILGKAFGQLTVKKYLGFDPEQHKHFYECLCSCGSLVKVERNIFFNVTKSKKSCGCLKKAIDKYDIIGKKINQLTVKEYVRQEPEFPYRHFYKCQCDCGKTVEIKRDCLMQKHTKSCGCANHKKANKSLAWKGYGGISGTMWSRIIRNAKDRKLSLQITIKDAWNQYEKQEGKCALTGLPLKIHARCRHESEKTASLDRIDNTKGYELGNIQWVHKDINWMKGCFSLTRFLELCNLVAKNRGEK